MHSKSIKQKRSENIEFVEERSMGSSKKTVKKRATDDLRRSDLAQHRARVRK